MRLAVLIPVLVALVALVAGLGLSVAEGPPSAHGDVVHGAEMGPCETGCPAGDTAAPCEASCVAVACGLCREAPGAEQPERETAWRGMAEPPGPGRDEAPEPAPPKGPGRA